MAESMKEFFDALEVPEDKLAGMEASFQFEATGDGGGDWCVNVGGGKAEVIEGKGESPTIVMTATAEDWLALVNGDLNGQTAFLTGKLKIQGDMTLAMKLESLFNLG